MRDRPGPEDRGAAVPWPTSPFVVLEGPENPLLFQNPVTVLRAFTPDEVAPVLDRVAAMVRDGHHAAGTVAYEAGAAFEPRLRGLADRRAGPLLCFGVFGPPVPFDTAGAEPGGALGPLAPAWSRDDYRRRFARVAAYIRAGDAYQVNLSFPLRGRWEGDPLALYAALRRRQPARFGGLVALGGETVLSFSPELFFETEGRTIRVRPMKGTAARGRNTDEDGRVARALASDPKNRAENLMIVDLLRNDLSRVSAIGSVTVTDLFTVEHHPTLLQMTSGVEARLLPAIGLPELLGSLFPCGSVTGAPKIRAMEIIAELEDTPRGVYCGAIGHVRPDGSSRFGVAIRTATLGSGGDVTFNVGSGVVADSDAASEYDECLLKARFLDPAAPSA